MNRNELTELLQKMADRDLVEGADIADHPCSIAIRALDQCFDDVDTLRSVVGNNARGKSKRVQVLVGLNYDPSW